MLRILSNLRLLIIITTFFMLILLSAVISGRYCAIIISLSYAEAKVEKRLTLNKLFFYSHILIITLFFLSVGNFSNAFSILLCVRKCFNKDYIFFYN